MNSTDLAPGLLLLLLGLFVILRTVNQDQTKRTLIDRILGKHATPAPSGTTHTGVTGRDVNAKATTGARAPGVAGHLGGDLVR